MKKALKIAWSSTLYRGSLYFLGDPDATTFELVISLNIWYIQLLFWRQSTTRLYHILDVKNYPKWQHFCECNISTTNLRKLNQTTSVFTAFNTRKILFLYVKTLLFVIRFQILSVIGCGRISGGEGDGRSVRYFGHFRCRPNFSTMSIIDILIELNMFLSDCKGVPKSVPKGGGKSVPNHDWRSACKGDYISGRIMNISAKQYVCKSVLDIKTS